MATTETVNLNIGGNATQQLQKLETQVGKLASKFQGLRNVLSGIAVTAFISNTLKFADSIQDLSDATGIATASILGFSTAVAQNGGDFEKAQTGIQKFVQTIGEAAEGSAKTQQAFADVGVTLQDLRTLSEQQILEKTIEGLADIDDYSKRAVVQTELLGKSLRGVNIKGVAAGLGAATAEGAKYAASIKSAAQVQQNLETSLNNLRIALLDVLLLMILNDVVAFWLTLIVGLFANVLAPLTVCAPVVLTKVVASK